MKTPFHVVPTVTMLVLNSSIPQNSSTTIGADKGQLEVENASDTDDEQVDYWIKDIMRRKRKQLNWGAVEGGTVAVNVMGRGRR
uniref:Uncharacterized protein n=1 Tax=Fagus sylvatica TaxID=28930 RepID=A0A2N9IL68_FAGSY